MLVQVKNVSKSFGEKKVLDNISFDIQENEIIGVMGRSGSGKSTLLNIVGLLDNKDSGEINLFNSHNPRELNQLFDIHNHLGCIAFHPQY